MLIPNKFNGYSPDGARQYPIDFGIGEIAALTAAGEAAAGTAAAAEGAGALGAGLTAAETLGTLGTGASALGTGAGIASLVPETIAALGPEAMSAYTAALANGASVAEAQALATSAAANAASTTIPTVAEVVNAGATVPSAPVNAGSQLANISNVMTDVGVDPTYQAWQNALKSGEFIKDTPLTNEALQITGNAGNVANQGIAGATTPIGPLGTPYEFANAEFLSGQANAADLAAKAAGMNAPEVATSQAAQAAANQAIQDLGTNAAYSTTAQAGAPSFLSQLGGGLDSLGSGLGKYFLNKDGTINWMKVAGAGLGGAGLVNMMNKPNNFLPAFQPKTGAQVGLGATLASNYKPQRRFADGGIAALSPNPTFPMSQQQTSRYAVPSQMPAGATDVRMAHLGPVAMAKGGHLGDYSDGGRLLKGPGDGVSDDIPATISGKQPARLADGEFVVPARIVSELGNGSTDAGAKKLYKMMDNIQKARKKTVKGKDSFAKDTKASKYLPV